jgi:hypothetical protein
MRILLSLMTLLNAMDVWASAPISLDKASITYEFNRKGWITLDCLKDRCVLRGKINGGEFHFAGATIPPEANLRPWSMEVYLDSMIEVPASFAANISRECPPGQTGGPCFFGINVYKGKVIQIRQFQRVIKEKPLNEIDNPEQ